MLFGLHSGRVLILSTRTADTPVIKSSVTRLEPCHLAVIIKGQGTYGKSGSNGHIIQQSLIQPLCLSGLLECCKRNSHPRRTLGIQDIFLLFGPFPDFLRFVVLPLLQCLVYLGQAGFTKCLVQELSDLASDYSSSVGVLFGVDLGRWGWGVRSDEGRDISVGWTGVFTDLTDDVGDGFSRDVMGCQTEFTTGQ